MNIRISDNIKNMFFVIIIEIISNTDESISIYLK